VLVGRRWNSAGQLGINSLVNKRAPEPVHGLYSYLIISAGGYHSCGVQRKTQALFW
jgi:hypothetical protein